MGKKKYIKNVGVMLDNEVHQMLVYASDLEETSISTYVRKLIENHLKEQEGKGNE